MYLISDYPLDLFSDIASFKIFYRYAFQRIFHYVKRFVRVRSAYVIIIKTNLKGVALYSQNLFDCMNNITPSGFGWAMGIF